MITRVQRKIVEEVAKKTRFQSGCGVPPLEITNKDFLFFPLCDAHDKAYLIARSKYLAKQITLHEAREIIRRADEDFEQGIKLVTSKLNWYKKLYWVPLGKTFYKTVNLLGWPVWLFNTKLARRKLRKAH